VIVQEAAKKNKKVSAHACGLDGIKIAVSCGVQLIEHGDFLDEEICEQMVKKEVFLTPTLSITYKFAHEGTKHGAMPWTVERAKKVLDAHIKSFQLAHRFGIKIAAGTDFNGPPMVPLGDNAFELELMVKAGFSPMEAIVAATRTGSEVLGIHSEVGTIEPGKLADLIIVDGNPLEDIRILQEKPKIRFVMKAGKILKSTLESRHQEKLYVR
jgi:imidazolonepropionase-like amidohydrolase